MSGKLIVNKTNNRKILKYLKEQTRPVIQKNLEKTLGIDKSLITHSIRELEGSNYVSVEKQGRKKQVTITERGKEVIDDLRSEPIGNEFKYYLEKVKAPDTRETGLRVLSRVAVEKYPKSRKPIKDVLKLMSQNDIKNNESDFSKLLFVLMHLCNKAISKNLLNKKERDSIAEKMTELIKKNKSIKVKEKGFDVWRVLKTETGLNDIFLALVDLIDNSDKNSWRENEFFIGFCLSFMPYKRSVEDKFWDHLKNVKDEKIKERYEKLIIRLSEDRLNLNP